MTRFICLFFVVTLLMGCATSPQTREELKSVAKENPTVMVYETYTTSRHFEDVVGNLQQKWHKCYDLDVTTTRTEGGMPRSRYTDTFHPYFVKKNNSFNEMTLQMTTSMKMLNKVPAGGEYIVALDVERAPGNKTKLTWYSRAWGWKDWWEINKQWSDGKDAPCLQ